MTTVVHRDAKTGRNIGHDLTGRSFFSLTIIGGTDKRCPNGYKIWRAKCVCGNVIEKPSYTFVRGGQKTCGCGPQGRPRIPEYGSHVNSLYANYRRAAAERGFVFELTKREARSLFEDNCTYCGSPPSQSHMHPGVRGVYLHGGIDRMNNKIGYVASNCVPCCGRCNFAKGTMSFDEFTTWITQVQRHMNL